MCREFLDHVRLWNRIEDLPRIEAEPTEDGKRVRFRSAEARRPFIGRLVDSLGGRVLPESRSAVRMSRAALARRPIL
jgi:hypothetical protein